MEPQQTTPTPDNNPIQPQPTAPQAPQPQDAPPVGPPSVPPQPEQSVPVAPPQSPSEATLPSEPPAPTPPSDVQPPQPEPPQPESPEAPATPVVPPQEVAPEQQQQSQESAQAAPAPVQPQPQPASAMPEPGQRQRKILLVEDDDSLANVYQTRLEAEGFDIRRVPNGEDALSATLSYKPDLILLDVMMPKVSGFDVLDILRNTPETAGVKIIMLTALSQESDKERARSLGVDEYLVKSQVVISEVVERIKAQLDL